MKNRRRVTIISVNDTFTPKTGGDYVYKVIKEEVLARKYTVNELSVPFLLRRLTKKADNHIKLKDFYRMLLHFRSFFYSLFKRLENRDLVITSASPAFPVFGHLVYHQPKAGICSSFIKQYLSLYEKIALTFHENEWLSPVWLFAKKSHQLHLSNSFFTRSLIKKLYGIDSFVLYPPVRITSLLRCSNKKKKTFGIIVARPKAITGITLLPIVAEGLPKDTRLIVIGEADLVGLNVIRSLRRKGVNINYLGYVDEHIKVKIFSSFSHYLHLSLNETFGITVVEAMAAGCVPIAPKSGGLPEYVPQNLLYEHPSDAAEKISSIGVDDWDLRTRLVGVAKQFAEENFRRKFAKYLQKIERLI